MTPEEKQTLIELGRYMPPEKDNIVRLPKIEENGQVDHPSHYGGKDNPYEAIKIIEAYNLDFSAGNVLKYFLRAGKKDNTETDLRKCLWYLKRHAARLGVNL